MVSTTHGQTELMSEKDIVENSAVQEVGVDEIEKKPKRIRAVRSKGVSVKPNVSLTSSLAITPPFLTAELLSTANPGNAQYLYMQQTNVVSDTIGALWFSGGTGVQGAPSYYANNPFYLVLPAGTYMAFLMVAVTNAPALTLRSSNDAFVEQTGSNSGAYTSTTTIFESDGTLRLYASWTNVAAAGLLRRLKIAQLNV